MIFLGVFVNVSNSSEPNMATLNHAISPNKATSIHAASQHSKLSIEHHAAKNHAITASIVQERKASQQHRESIAAVISGLPAT